VSVLLIGLISGTSADGVDAALVRFQEDGDIPEPVAALTHPYPNGMSQRLHSAMNDGQCNIEDLVTLDADIGDAFAAAAISVAESAGIDLPSVSAIGSHGQTLGHFPARGSTLQVGDPNRIAARTGLPVVADVRRADMAAGGQGAPLAPLLHRVLFRVRREPLAVLNLGGIANLSVIRPGEATTGFDSGPANALLDDWSRHCGVGPYDADGAFARSGMVDEDLFRRLAADAYFSRKPPKSTGREYFNLAWLTERLGDAGIAPESVQATLVELSVRTIADAFRAHADGVDQLLLCGGGVHNAYLLERLADALPGVTVDSMATLGVDPDFVEATLLAWLAWLRIHARSPEGLGAITGAEGKPVLGGIWMPPGI
jgi:anhydro-N-acetylmuramic acid kinase